MIQFGIFRRISISFLLIAANSNAANITTAQVEQSLQFIRKVQNQLKLTSEPNVILLIGNTGSGKSTLAHYVADDYSKLRSIEPTDDKIEYTIHDGLDPDVDKISSTTVSRTLVPEMLIDESNIVWYDCPGFGDTRNTTVEIASTFLIKSVIENASNIKFVLVVNHGAVVEGYDRFDLDKLMTHTTQLVQNVDRYKNSISMVVTKVQPYANVGRKFVEVVEEKVKKSVANYLAEYRKVLMEKGSSSAKIQLVDAVSKQSDSGEFARIGVFWRPGDAGALNSIVKMVRGRKLIRDTVLRQTVYTEVHRNDFGYSLTDTAQLKIAEMAKYEIDDVQRILSEIDRKMLNLLQMKINGIDEFHERMALLGKISRIIETMKSSSANSTISNLAGTVNTLTNELNLTLNSNELQRMVRLEQNLNIFKSLAQSEINVPISDYISNMLVSTFDYIKREHEWSTFLVRVYEFFGEYDVQKDVTLYNVMRLEDWKKSQKTQGLHITANNLQEFAKHFSSNEFFEVTQSKLDELNEIIEFTLKSAATAECNGDTMTIKGNFVKSSDIQSFDERRSNVSKMRVLVAAKFFVDSDLHLDKELEILADKWIVMGAFTFHLNGDSGKTMDEPDFSSRANIPRIAGSNGNNFFGLANTIIDGDLLTVNISGGNGESGQDGTQNRDQHVEHIPTMHKGWIRFSNYVSDYYENYLSNNHEYVVERYQKEEKSFRYFAVLWLGTWKTNYYRLYTRRCCEQTGLGDLGGVGGFAGQHRFITTGAAGKLPRVVAVDGAFGAPGKDPEPCKSFAAKVVVTTKDDVVPFIGIKLDSTFEVVDRPENLRCRARFVVNSRPPSTPNAVTPFQPANAIVEFKTFLRHKMADLIHIRSLRTAYNAIDLND